MSAQAELPRISNCNYTATTAPSLTGGTFWTGGANWDLLGPTFTYTPPTQEEGKTKPMTNQRRIVQVFIADPNENVPLDLSLLYQDEKPRLTDLTDQELFFEIDIKEILARHNDNRTQLVDKKASEGKNKDVMLEPAKVRDLKMTVVNVATF